MENEGTFNLGGGLSPFLPLHRADMINLYDVAFMIDYLNTAPVEADVTIWEYRYR